MHYCVANMPGAVARSSTIALGNATLPFLLALADKGWRDACRDDPHLLAGLNTHARKLTNFAVGQALTLDVHSPKLAPTSPPFLPTSSPCSVSSSRAVRPGRFDTAAYRC